MILIKKVVHIRLGAAHPRIWERNVVALSSEASSVSSSPPFGLEQCLKSKVKIHLKFEITGAAGATGSFSGSRAIMMST